MWVMDFAEDREGTKDKFAFLVYFLKIQAPTNPCLKSTQITYCVMGGWSLWGTSDCVKIWTVHIICV